MRATAAKTIEKAKNSIEMKMVLREPVWSLLEMVSLSFVYFNLIDSIFRF